MQAAQQNILPASITSKCALCIPCTFVTWMPSKKEIEINECHNLAPIHVHTGRTKPNLLREEKAKGTERFLTAFSDICSVLPITQRPINNCVHSSIHHLAHQPPLAAYLWARLPTFRSPAAVMQYQQCMGSHGLTPPRANSQDVILHIPETNVFHSVSLSALRLCTTLTLDRHRLTIKTGTVHVWWSWCYFLLSLPFLNYINMQLFLHTTTVYLFVTIAANLFSSNFPFYCGNLAVLFECTSWTRVFNALYFPSKRRAEIQVI